MKSLTCSLTITLLTICFCTASSGCSSGPALPKTPNLYPQAGVEVFESMPADRQSVEVDLLYATDRKAENDGDGNQKYYNEKRSNSLAFGNATVRLGRDIQWSDLVENSTTTQGSRIPLALTQVEEQVRFPSSIALPIKVGDEIVSDPEWLREREAAEHAVQDELSRRLANASKREVYIYVHGVGNSFEDPMYTMASLWHFLGRPGVPIVYTWPAVKGGGPLRGYTYARESSEFTVYHMRQFIQTVAACPDVERIHILAHSRGTGVILSALRDLRLIYLDDVKGGRTDLRLGNVILAAPDIDLQVAQQRFRPDDVRVIHNRMTMYVTPEDKALGLAEFLFNSLTRLGSTQSEDLTEEQIEALRSDLLGIDVIDVKVKDKGSHGHSYWLSNPAVLSDVILVLRDDLEAGAANGRPLLRADSGLWEIYDGYPYAGPHGELINGSQAHDDSTK